jgi:hypothetical protein
MVVAIPALILLALVPTEKPLEAASKTADPAA